MFDKNFEDRMRLWHDFRKNLEVSPDPIQDVIDFYKNAPLVRFSADPYDQSTWPSPWELLFQNQYCEFSTVLGQCYSLQLTERFNNEPFKIHIITDIENSAVHYLLQIGERVIGYDRDRHINISEIPKNLKSQQQYSISVNQ